jgi:predicted O-linked N-acetylglucosamine transferase (SPINDLY family)
MFDLWMQIMAAVDGSVLWLRTAGTWCEQNLRRAAAGAGIAPERLLFAQTVPLADHLARYRRVDLFLDTFPYNAHTTASDALWMGAPVVTLRGRSFASRVCASLLHSVGLPELVTDTPDRYVALAIDLARDPNRLAAYRAHLEQDPGALPAFDTGRYVAAFGDALASMWQQTLTRAAAGVRTSTPR